MSIQTGPRRIAQVVITAVVTIGYLSACREHATGPEPGLAASLSSPRVFHVQPNGVDDTENLRSAIAAATDAGAGSTVVLGAGEFKSNYLVLDGFRGHFKGQGIGKTILRNIDRLDFGNVQAVEGMNPTYENPWPIFITAVGGAIEITDMTIRIVGPEPALPYFHLGATWDIPQYVLRITGEHADSRISRVRFEGEPGTLIGYNTFLGVYWASTLDGPDPLGVAGVHELTNSEFDGLPFPIGSVAENARITIGGSAEKGNVIYNSLLGMVINDAHNAQVDVTHNRISTSGTAVRLWQGYFYENHSEVLMPPPALARFRASHNDIIVGNAGEGITVRDAALVKDGVAKLEASLVGNRITLQGGCAPGICAAITANGANGISIANNHVRGAGDVGILLGRSANSKLTGNDLLELSPGVAHVFLGRLARDNIVVGEQHGTVVDRGSNNHIAPPSPAAARMNTEMILPQGRERMSIHLPRAARIR